MQSIRHGNRASVGLAARRARRSVALACCAGLLAATTAVAAEPGDAEKLLRAGKYVECIEMCRTSLEAGEAAEGWWAAKLQGELAVGRYSDALKTYEAAIERQPRSIRTLLLGRTVLQFNDRPKDADAIPATIVERVVDTPWRYGTAADRVVLGRALLLGGEDARRVLEGIYDPIKKADPTSPEPFLASGDLALDKNDFAIAAADYEAAAKRDPENPAAYLGLARAYESDAKRSTAALEKALALNPNYIDALLLRADALIDREAYAEAEAILARVLEINPQEHRAWANRAVLAHLAGDGAKEKASRDQALSPWKTNPAVDHLIGLKLSQKYRFAEGRAYQERSLAMAADYMPAKVQLCQDLLRLGEEAQGWPMAAEIFKADPYNVLAFNLTTLRDQIAKYRLLPGDRVTVRMEPREADLYGKRVIDLLAKARETLTKKYDVDLPSNVIVEIFPKQKDFAIRTFGLPGGAGYLGVCFGSVITVNSPASRMARPANWEAVLWHELCHAVTLHKTRNKMPRWLSEGISVYEERLANATWGQVMNPQYRRIILDGEATPVSQLSGAFLKATTPLQLSFAYYESSMAVRFVVERFGIEAIRAVLTDLGQSVPINDALAKHTVPLEKLDADFDAWLREQASALASNADLSREGVPLEGDSAALSDWNLLHPNNVWGLLGEGQALLAEEKWQAALVPLARAAVLYPGYAEADGPYVLMAAAYRELKDAKSERAMLAKHASLSADAVEPRLRLMELAAADGDWSAVKAVAGDTLAINPLVAPPHQYLARAAEALNDRPTAIAARQALLILDPLDPSGQHYQLAKLLAAENQLDAAKRHVLESIEETPRYRDAHQLLLQIVERQQPATRPVSPVENAR